MREADRILAESKQLLLQNLRQAEREEADRKREGGEARRDRTEARRVAQEAKARVTRGAAVPGVAATPEAAGRMAGAVDRESGARERLNRQLRTEAVARRQALREQFRQESTSARVARNRLPVVYRAPLQTPGGAVLVGQQTPAESIARSGSRIRQAVQLESAALRERYLQAARHTAEFNRVLAQPPQLALPAGDPVYYQRLEDQARRAAAFSARQQQLLLGPGKPQLLLGSGAPPVPPVPPRPTAAAPGEPPEPPRVPVKDSLAADSAAQAAAERERLLQGSLAAARGETALTGALERSSLALGASSNEMQRHGYLTSEFITAAARGTTTFRELGAQVGGTIAKFAGWTAAAGAVYAALGAIQALGRGAIESSSGVGLLSRVTTTELPGGSGELERRFRDLSQKFNLPIADVTQAAYGSAKAFGGDLPQALQATEQALFAVKVGELSAGDATLSLNAIVKGFQLSAEELPLVFDTINQAQNRFGGNVGDLVKGVGKAGGAFRNAGGNYRELIAILSTGARLTGVPETEVATAVQRAVSTVQTPQGQARLAAVGLGGDPEQTFTDLLREASAKAQGASRAEVNRIARALIPAGGQFARLFVPILQNRGLYEQVYGALDPEKAQGSSQRELDRALSQINEQLKAVITNAEQLGSALSQAGGLNLLAGLVKGLNLTLDAATAVLDIINRVGDGIRAIPIVGEAFHGLALPLAQLGLMVRLLRRFDAGASLPAGRIADTLRRPEGPAFGARLRQGITDQRKFLEEERRTAAYGAARATFHVQSLEAESAEAGRRVVAPVGTPERLKQQEEAVAAHKRYEQEQARAAQLERNQVFASQKINALKDQELEYQRLRATGLSERLAAEGAGFQYINPELDRPLARQPVPIAGIPSARAAPPVGPVLGPRVAPGRYAATAQAAADRAAAQVRRFTGEGTRLGTAMAGFGTAVRGSGVAGRTVGAAARTAAGAASAARTGLRAAGSGLGSLWGQLGGLDKAIIGAVAVYMGYQSVSRNIESADARVKSARRPTTSPESLRAKARELDRQANKGSFSNILQDTFYDPLAEGFNFITGQGRHVGSFEKQTAQADAARREASRLERAQAQGRELPLRDIMARFNRRLVVARDEAEIDDAIASGRQELVAGFARQKGGPTAQAAADQVEANFRARAADLRAAQGRLDEAATELQSLAAVKGLVDLTATRFQQEGPTRRNFRASGIAVAAGREQARTDPAGAADAIAAAETAKNNALQVADAEMQRALAVAASPRARTRARTTYLTRIREVLQGGVQRRIRAIGTDIRQTDADITKAEIAVEDAKRGQAFTIGGRALVAKKKAELTALRAKIADLRRRRVDLEQDAALMAAELAQLEAELADAKNADADALFDATTAAKAAFITDPAAAARYQVGRAEQKAAAILKRNKGNTRNTDYQNALAAVGNARQQVTQAEVDNFGAQLEASRSAANIGASEESKLQGAVSDAQALLGHLQGKGAQRSEILGAMTTLNNARAALVDYMRQSAEDIAAARVEYQLSLTEDPIKKARIEYRGAQQQVKFARTPADRLRAEANVNNKRRELQSTIYGERISDIDLDLDLEKIDASQAITRYEQLLKTMKGNKQLKNDLRRKIHQLKKDLESDTGDLNLDNLKLPTTYEIRRAVGGGRQGMAITNQYRTQINVTDPQTALLVGDQMERYHEGSGKAVALAVGLR